MSKPTGWFIHHLTSMTIPTPEAPEYYADEYKHRHSEAQCLEVRCSWFPRKQHFLINRIQTLSGFLSLWAVRNLLIALIFHYKSFPMSLKSLLLPTRHDAILSSTSRTNQLKSNKIVGVLKIT